jgi:hypothetical protein
VLRELLSSLLQLPSAADELAPEEQGLMQLVAKAVAVTGLGAEAVAAAEAAGAGGPLAIAIPTAAAAVGAGVGLAQLPSPGFFHTFLGVYLRLVLESVCIAAPVVQQRVVNAVHLLRQLMGHPAMLAPSSMQLYFPCVLKPLVKVLVPEAAPCLAAQYQVLLLVWEVLQKQPQLVPLWGLTEAEVQQAPSNIG